MSWSTVTSALGPQTLAPAKEALKSPIILPTPLRLSLQGPMASQSLIFPFSQAAYNSLNKQQRRPR